MHRRTPENEGRRSSLIALFCLMREALSGYGVRQRLQAWRIDEYLSVSPATIYRVLERLEKDGLLSSREERNGLYPTSRVYRITAKGLRTYRAFVRQEADFRRTPYAVTPFLGLASYLPARDRMACAKRWIAKAQAQVKALETRIADRRPGRTYGKPYAEWLMMHHEAHQLKAEVEWLRHYIQLLRQRQA